MKRLFKTVLIISIFSCITRALGFLFRIYLSRNLGAEALGSYQVAISVFGVLCTLIASGLPVILSRDVAKYRADGNVKMTASSIGSGLLLSLIISIISCGLIALYPNVLNLIFTDENSSYVLILLLPGVIATAIYATFRGALWGYKKLVWLEVTELFEQLIRIVLCYIFFNCLTGFMQKSRLAALSLSISCILSCIMVSIVFFAHGGKMANPKYTFKQITKSSTPITAVRSLSSIVTSLIAIIIPMRLVVAGITESEALAEFGIMSGMTLPLLSIPGTLIGSLAVALIPEISSIATNIDKLEDKEKRATIKAQINNAIGVAVVLSFLLFPVYLVLGKEIGLFLFNNAKAGEYLILSCWVMIPMGICQITNSVLNAIGLEMKSLINYAAGAIFMFIAIFFLPKYLGINSLIVGTGAMYVVTSVMNLSMLKKRKLLTRKHINTFFYMIVTSVFCASFSRFAYNILKDGVSSFTSLFIAGLVSVASLIVLILIFNIANASTLIFKKSNKTKVKTQDL